MKETTKRPLTLMARVRVHGLVVVGCLVLGLLGRIALLLSRNCQSYVQSSMSCLRDNIYAKRLSNDLAIITPRI